MSAFDFHQLLADPLFLPAEGGQRHQIVFNMRALGKVEAHFGTISKAVDALNHAVAQTEAGFEEPVMDNLRALYEAAADAPMDDCAVVGLGVVLGMLVAAWRQAFPTVPDDASELEGDGKGKAEAPTLGATPTT